MHHGYDVLDRAIDVMDKKIETILELLYNKEFL